VTELHADALSVLESWVALDPETETLRTQFLAHLYEHDDGVWRSCLPAHLTASTMVLDAAGEQVLLTLHRRGGFWGQLGGHCEPADTSLAGAALREAREESGLDGLRLLPGPVDLDRHRLAAAFQPCGEHLDVRYAALAPPGAVPVVSDESHDLRWWPMTGLPPGSVADLGRLVERAVTATHSQ
jgi:8-oxo-dGTP pyrophosphatase MutT (NUDIX family)